MNTDNSNKTGLGSPFLEDRTKELLIDRTKELNEAKEIKQTSSQDLKVPILNKYLTKNQTFQSSKSLSESDVKMTSSNQKSLTSQSIFKRNFPRTENQSLEHRNGIEKNNFIIKQKTNMENEKNELLKKIDILNKKLEECFEKDTPLDVLANLGNEINQLEVEKNKIDLDILKLVNKLSTKESTNINQIDKIDKIKAELKEVVANVRMVTISDGKAEASLMNDADCANKKLSDVISLNPDTGTVKVTKDRENEFKGLVGTTIRFEVAPKQFKEVTITKVEILNNEELAAISRGLYIYQNQSQDNSKLEEDAKKNKNLQSTTSQQPASRSEAKEVNKANVNDKQQTNATDDVKLKSTQGQKDSPVKQLEKYFEASLKKFEKIQQSVDKHELFLENKKTDYENHELRKEIRNELEVRIYTLLKEINHRKVVLPPETSTRLRILSTRLVELDSIPKDKINMDNSKELASLKKEMVQLLEETTTTTGKMEATSRGSEGKPTSPA